jgi:hypothetical protein
MMVEDVCFRVKCKHYSLVMIALILTVPSIVGAFAVGSTSTTTIHAQIMPKVIILPPVNPYIWEINLTSPGIYTKTLVLHIMANIDWQLSVKEEDSDSSGFMREWMGNRYGSRWLSNPLKISADKELNLTNNDRQPIKEGKITGKNGADVQVMLTQVVTPEEMSIQEGKVYRKVLTFIGIPQK